MAQTGPFLAQGIVAGELVMVQAGAVFLARMRAQLGPRAERVRCVDVDGLGSNPAVRTALWLSFADELRATDRLGRGLAAHAGPGHHPAALAEARLGEARLNAAVQTDTPLWLRCGYDLDRADAAELEDVARTHPALVEGSLNRDSQHYAGATRLQSLFEQDLPDPGPWISQLHFTQRVDLATVRTQVLCHSDAAGINSNTAGSLAMAVHEIALNALAHGGGHGVLTLWRTPTAFICEVRDPGRLTDLLVGHQSPDPDRIHGRGLWMVNQLCDLVQARSGYWGTTIRVTTWR